MEARDFVRRLWVLMATVFVDMIGFLVVLPLLPFYAERLGADALVVGALVATFAFAQLATAPLWGKLSDRWGRRPMILAGLLASALAFLVFALADAVWLLFLSRLVQGAAGGTTGVVQAYVSDSVGPEHRAKALGWLTAATSAGVMIGPAVGSLAAAFGPSAPGFIASGLCLLNWVFAWWWLPESRRAGADGATPRRGSARQVMAQVLRDPRRPVSRLIWIYAAGMMAFMAMNGVIALFLERRFGFTEQTIGWLYVFVGSISLVMRSLVLGPMVRRLGEVRVLRLGALSLALGLLLIPLPGKLAVLACVVLLIPVGTALLFPATTSQVSALAPVEETGLVLGVQQSFGGVARMLGPIWSGAAFEHAGIGAPFWIASAVMWLTLLFAGGVREPERRLEEAPAADSSLAVEP